MKKEYLYGIIGLLSGALLVLIFANNAVNSNNSSMMRMMGMHKFAAEPVKSTANMSHMMPDGSMMGNMDDGMTMDDMTQVLRGKSGDEFDKEFINQMIDHHQGAIDMANLALKNAKHQELIDLSNAILEAQTSEINQMKSWEEEWGY